MSSSFSSTSIPTPTTSAEATATTSSSASGPQTSSTLYLFTFLATLFVLLLISATIIFRSFIIRRRFRRRVEGAMAQGIFFDIPPSGLDLPSHLLGEKPTMHEAWVDHSVLQEKAHWEVIMPVTALLNRRVEPSTESRSLDDLSQRKGLSCLARFTQHPVSIDPRSQPAAIIPPEEPPIDETVSVCVLISMPRSDSPMHWRHSTEDITTISASQPAEGKRASLGATAGRTTDEEGVPDVVFGVAELPFLGGWGEADVAS